MEHQRKTEPGRWVATLSCLVLLLLPAELQANDSGVNLIQRQSVSVPAVASDTAPLAVQRPALAIGDSRTVSGSSNTHASESVSAAVEATVAADADAPSAAQRVAEPTAAPQPTTEPAGIVSPGQWTSPEGLGSSIQVMLLLSVLSLAPAILLMTTCYVRIIIVLSLLRQAIGLQSLPPTQVLTSVALFMTLLVMTPVWSEVYEDAIKPYTDPETEMTLAQAYEIGSVPIRRFMSQQIATAENHEDVTLFYRYAEPDSPMPSSFADVPIRVLLPAYILSELKIAFLMGFKIFLPFLIVDLVVASVTMSMGMLMLPPHVISLPLKLLLFVLVDGWRMVVEMLMNSFMAGG